MHSAVSEVAENTAGVPEDFTAFAVKASMRLS